MQHDGGNNGIARSLWPFGFALAAVVLLVGLVISWWLVAIGGGAAVVIGGLWIVDSIRRRHPHLLEQTTEHAADARAAAPAHRPAAPAPGMSRSRFLEASTLGLGAVMGGALTAPAVGFMIAPAFERQRHRDADLGPIDNYPEGTFMVTTFMLDKRFGDVSRRTAYVRYNGLLQNQPSFTIISNRCAHLGCPVQPSGPISEEPKTIETPNGEVTLRESNPAGFSCPCHGGSYDAEGNRTAGPPVRALDRYEYSIRDGSLYLGRMFSVGTVDGTGAEARIRKFTLAAPGQHVDDWQWWLYPLQPPH